MKRYLRFITNQLPPIQFGHTHMQQAIRVETELHSVLAQPSEDRADDFIRIAEVFYEYLIPLDTGMVLLYSMSEAVT